MEKVTYWKILYDERMLKSPSNPATYKFNSKGECYQLQNINSRRELIKIESDGIASLQLLSRINVNKNINDRRRIDRLNVPQTLKKWLDEYYVMDNFDILLVHKFNARARSERSKIKMVLRERTIVGWKGQVIYMNVWHLQYCKKYSHCICKDVLNDPGCIFDNTPSQIPVGECIWYFEMLAIQNYKTYFLGCQRHFLRCNGKCVCANSIAKKNPEQFFNVPSEDKFRLLTMTEIRELRKEWINLNDKIRKFNIVCRILGKVLTFVKTESAGYHLNRCGYDGIFICECKKALNTPAKYFVSYLGNNKYRIRDEDEIHSEDCARVKILRNPYERFPDNFDCNCNIQTCNCIQDFYSYIKYLNRNSIRDKCT